MSSPYKFKGVLVARTDAEACAVSCGEYICTRLKGHEGMHVAHIFSEKTGKPIREVGSAPNDYVPMTVLERNVINSAKVWWRTDNAPDEDRALRALGLAVQALSKAEGKPLKKGGL